MTDDEIKAAMKEEIAAARKILAEDGVHVRLSKIEEKLTKAFPEPPEPAPPADPGKPAPPPSHPPAPSQAEQRRKGWWPEDSEPEPVA